MTLLCSGVTPAILMECKIRAVGQRDPHNTTPTPNVMLNIVIFCNFYTKGPFSESLLGQKLPPHPQQAKVATGYSLFS